MSSFVRAAASSRASGRPSTRLQIASIVMSGASSRPTCRARSTKSALASPDGRGSTRYSRSPETRSGARLVMRTRSPADTARASLTAGAAVRRCSKLSSSTSSSLPRRKPLRSSGAPIACPISVARSSWIREAVERHPEDSVTVCPDELGGSLESEPRLPGPTRAGKCDEARAVREQRDQLGELLLSCPRAGSPPPGGSLRRASRAAGSRRRRAGTDVLPSRGPSGGARRGRAA